MTLGEGALAVGSCIVARAKPAASGHVVTGKLTKLLTDRAQHLLVWGGEPQAGADAGAGWRSDDERRGERTHVT